MRWPWSRRRTFDSPPRPIDQLFAELYGRGTTAPVARTEALSVPAVVQGRNAICAIATLPLEQLGPDNQVVDNALLRQFDLDTPNVTHLSQTIEDLIFDSISWWMVTARDFAGFPISVRHLDAATVSLQPPVTDQMPAPLPSGVDPRGALVWVDGKAVEASRVIRFDSPNPPLTKVGARAIRRAIELDRAASRYADDPRPSDYFTPADGADPVDDDEVLDILRKSQAARKQRATAYIPAALQYHTVDSPSPRELQLVELQRQVGVEIANLFGLDSEDLGVSTTSRTYANAVDRRRDRINDTLAPFMRAITDRLSMGDVTKRGYTVVFQLDDFLKADPTTRWSTYQTAKDMGAMTVAEIRQAEGLPPLPAGAEPAAAGPAGGATTRELQLVEQIQKIYLGVGTVITATEAREILNRSGAGLDVGAPVAAEPEPEVAEAVDAARRAAGLTFADGPALTFADLPVVEFSVDRENRVIEGLALPYGKVASQGGLKFRFQRGALQVSDVPRVKLLRDHDTNRPLGKAMQLKDTAAGFLARFKVARGTAGDEALELAEDGVLDGFSVGVDFDLASDTAPDARDKTVMVVQRADLREVSLTAMPSFDDARVTKVAASRTQGGPVPDDTVTEPEAPETTPEPSAPVPQTFTAEQVTAMLNAVGLPAPAAPDAPETDEGPTPVDPTRTVRLSAAREPAPYRFGRDGSLRVGSHDFGIDFVRAVHPDHRDQAAHDRVMEFMRAQFTVVSGDVDDLNPTINVPRYIDEREFTYPIYSAVSRGAPPNGINPFQWPKFNSASGLVAAHVQGTEPTSGNYTTTVQSVTPVPLSGKASISRETWDMGGVPGVGDIIWQRITRDWYETLEASIVTLLDAATPTSLGTFTIGGGVGHATLVQEMRRALALLQFVRGGFRFDTAFAEAGLYTHLADSFDSTGRPLFPVMAPQNADGDSAARWATVNIGGVPFLPAWALGAAIGAVPDSSYLIDRTAVDCWSTPPQRLTFDMTEVAFVHIGVWGYHAEAINDLAGVREIAYDPA